MQQQEAQEECIHSQHTPLSTLPAHSFEHMSFRHASLENMTEESTVERIRFYKELSEKNDRSHKARAAWSPPHGLRGEEVFSSVAEADRVLDRRQSIREAKRTASVRLGATGVIGVRFLKHTSMDMNWYHEHEY